MEFHERLRLTRKENNMKQKDVAALMYMPQSTYSGYETGDRLPNIEIVAELARIFNVSIDYLLCNTEEKIVKKTVPSEYQVLVEEAIDSNISADALRKLIRTIKDMK